MQQREPRSVQCRDAMDRQGEVTIGVRNRVAVLTVPPGEAALLTVRQVSELIDRLRVARDELFRVDS